MASLKDRFIFSVLSPLNIFLKITGVFVIKPESKWKRRLFRFWSYFWLALCVQANIYILIRRTSNIVNLLFYQKINVDRQIRELLIILFLVTAIVIDTVNHVNLITTISSTTELFLDSLEAIDRDLRRPRLSSYLNRFSLIGVVYLLSTVRFDIKFFCVFNSIINFFKIWSNLQPNLQSASFMQICCLQSFGRYPIRFGLSYGLLLFRILLEFSETNGLLCYLFGYSPSVENS